MIVIEMWEDEKGEPANFAIIDEDTAAQYRRHYYGDNGLKTDFRFVGKAAAIRVVSFDMFVRKQALQVATAYVLGKWRNFNLETMAWSDGTKYE